MTRAELYNLIKKKRSFLCVGLDSDPAKLPDHLRDDPNAMVSFNKAIIDATLPFAVSYKLNIAFYEALGSRGWKMLEDTIAHIPKDEALVIADAKRGDIGNTAAQYAKAFFDSMDVDAITVNPYMGEDSVTPFLEYKDKWTIVLGLTSNKGAKDVELLRLQDGRYVFEAVMERISELGSDDQLMFVVGATQSDYLSRIRKVASNHFLLVPGVGAQGGKLEDLESLMTDDCGLLVNSSRKIIFASQGKDFAEAAATEAQRMQETMASML